MESLTVEDDSEESEKQESKKSLRVEREEREERLAKLIFASEKQKKTNTPEVDEKPEKPEKQPEEPEKPETIEKPPELPEAESVSEEEAPMEKAGEEEIREVINPQLVEVIKAENADADPLTDPPVNELWEQVQTGVDLDKASHNVLTKMGVETDEYEADSEARLSAAEEGPEETQTEEEPDDGELRIDHDAETKPPVEEAGPADEKEETPPESTPEPPTGGSGTGSVPPFGQFGGPEVPGGENRVTPVEAPERPIPDSERYYQTNPAAMALFGGIIGYLIGRRRGRIKTEKKLLPVQKKLEKQVTDLKWELKKKESRIRRAAAERVRQEGPAVLEIFSKPEAAEAAAGLPLVRPERLAAEKRHRAPEANQLHGSQKAPELLGQVVIAAEALPESRTGKAKPEAGTPEKAKVELPRDRRVETLNRTELMEISEKIIVDGTSLRQIYETHLIGERGLRRLVAEHLRGDDLKKALRQEIIEREMDFERDPAMRDMAATGAGASPASGKAALNRLIERASADVSGSEEAAFVRARTAYESRQQQQQEHKRRLLDISLVGIILVLAALISLIILTSQ